MEPCTYHDGLPAAGRSLLAGRWIEWHPELAPLGLDWMFEAAGAIAARVRKKRHESDT